MARTASRHRADRPRRPLRLEVLEDRATPAADIGFAMDMGIAPPGEGKAIATDLAGNVVFAGTVFTGKGTAHTTTALVVSEFAADGTPLWSESLATDAHWNLVRGVATDSGGNIYVTGLFTGSGDFDPGPGVVVLAAPRTADGEVINSFVVKLNPVGETVWARSFGGTGDAEATGLGIDAQGNVIVAGRFQGMADFDPGPGKSVLSAGGTGDAFIAKLDQDGNFQWARAIGGADDSTARGVAVDAAGNAFIGGSFSGSAQFGDHRLTAAGPLDGYLAAYTPAGAVAWVKTFGGGPSTEVAGVALDGAGSIYAVGNFSGTSMFGSRFGRGDLSAPEGGTGAFITRMSTTGGMEWARAIVGDAVEAVGVAAAADGVFVTGSFTGTADFDPGAAFFNLTCADRENAFMTKLEPAGTLAWSRAIGGASDDRGEGIALGGDRVYATGTFEGQVEFATPGGVRTLDAGDRPNAFLVQIPRSPAASPNEPPKVALNGTFDIAEGQTLVLTATATDRENDPLTFAWDVNGDGIFTDATTQNATLSWAQIQNLDVTDNTPGRPLRLRVSDGQNPPVVMDATLIIENTAPRAMFRAGPAVQEGTAGRVTFTLASDPSRADTAAGFRYSYDFNDDGKWDAGDGQTFAGGVSEARATVPANFLRDSGPHTVRARIFDKDGGFADYRTRLMVLNVAPKGRFAADGPVNEGRTGLVRFTGLTDVSPADIRAGFRFSYDFNNDGVYEVGDGTTFAGSVTARQWRVPASYFADGGRSLVVRARVFDKDGGYSEYLAPITVNNVAPTAVFRTIGRSVVGSPIALVFGGQTDPSAADRAAGFTYAFAFDANGPFGPARRSPIADHTFAAPGTYKIRGRIADKEGGTREYAVSVTVVERTPTPVGPLDVLELTEGGAFRSQSDRVV